MSAELGLYTNILEVVNTLTSKYWRNAKRMHSRHLSHARTHAALPYSCDVMLAARYSNRTVPEDNTSFCICEYSTVKQTYCSVIIPSCLGNVECLSTIKNCFGATFVLASAASKEQVRHVAECHASRVWLAT